MTGTLAPEAPERHDNFAAIRLVAAILVVFGHAFPLTGGTGPAYLGSAVSTMAVKVFFVISGYLIAGSWLRDPHVGRYLLRRVLRILPGLVVLCLLTVLLVGPVLTSLSIGSYFTHGGAWKYLSNIALLPNYSLPGVFDANIYPSAVNGSLWTLPVEFAMYLLLPLVMFVPARRYVLVVFALATSAASLWYTRLHIPQAVPVFWGTSLVSALEMAPYFLWGAVYRVWVPRRALNLQVGFMLLIVLLLFARGWASSEAVALVLTPYLTLAFGYARSPAFSWAERFGDPSYGTYLYGFLCQQIVANFYPVRDAPLTNFTLSVIPALALGMLSWRLIEKPALHWKPLRRKDKEVVPEIKPLERQSFFSNDLTKLET